MTHAVAVAAGATYDGAVKPDMVFDTSSWINAERSGLLSFVLDRFTLHYTPIVASELWESFSSGREFRQRVEAGELHEVLPSRMHIRDFGIGERSAISAAMEHPGWRLLLDDRRPFREAIRMGLNATCTPLLAVTLYHEQRMELSELVSILAQLTAIRTVSMELIDEAVGQIGEPHANE